MVQQELCGVSFFLVVFGLLHENREKCNKSENFGCPLLDTHVSGSPIIEDGKLVGAVTRVLVNDPTTGYGIFIENKLDAAA